MNRPMSQPLSQSVKIRQWLLASFVALLALVTLSLVNQFTAARIARNERAWFEAQIDAMIPAALHDNDLLNDRTLVIAPDALGGKNPVAIYRAKLRGAPTAAIITALAPGYSGPIELLVAVSYAGDILGVHVTQHHETPGMGDAFAQPGSIWLDTFTGRSLTRPETRGWNVHKDGGEFAQFTSATITPRTIIHAVQRALDYYQRNREQLFQAQAQP